MTPTATASPASVWDQAAKDLVMHAFVEGAKTAFWKQYEHPRPTEVRVWFIEEEGADGGFSALCPELPGIGSQGETIAEAEANLRDAIAGAIAEYRGTTGTIPWQRSLDLVPPANAKERWIVVSG